MKTVLVALIILVAYPASARQEQTGSAAQPVAFFDVLDLPLRVDEPKLQKIDGRYALKCALANRSGEQLIGLRWALLLVDSSSGRVSRMSWNEAAEVPAYSIKTFEFHPPIKDETKDENLFLGIDEVIGRETIWRTVDADKVLRAYARGQHGEVPKVQKVQNKYDKETPRAISAKPRLP